MAELVGGKWLFGGGVLITSIFTLLTPIVSKILYINCKNSFSHKKIYLVMHFIMKFK